MKTAVLVIGMLLLTVCLAFGQAEEKGFIKGYVIGYAPIIGNQYPVSEAMIAVFKDKTKDGAPVGFMSFAVSNEQGEYEVSLPPGYYILTASKVNYNPVIQEATVISKATSFLDLHLIEEFATTGNIYKAMLAGVWDLTSLTKADGIVIKPPDAEGKVMFTAEHYSYSLCFPSQKGVASLSRFGKLEVKESSVILTQEFAVETNEQEERIQYNTSPRVFEMPALEPSPETEGKFKIGNMTIAAVRDPGSGKPRAELTMEEEGIGIFTFERSEQIYQYLRPASPPPR